MRKFLSVVAAGSLLAGCADAGNSTPGHDFTAGIDLNIAALNLQGVGDVVWDLQVQNGKVDGSGNPAPDTVWQQRITSSTYGDSAGSASYVGPCDADATANVKQNTVSVWVVGVYDADVTATEAGGFNAAVSTAANGVPFQNPTWYDANTNGVRDAGDTNTPLTRVFTCLENQDVFVQFDVALMRPAQQGFFDIAVNFNSIFCSAKFDCSYANQGTCSTFNAAGTCSNGVTGDCGTGAATQAAADANCLGQDPINLLHNSDSQRDATYILGFACTAGAGTGRNSELYLDDLTIDCASGDLRLSTAGTNDGNQCTAGNGTTAAMTCPSGILYDNTTPATPVDIGATGTTRLFQFAIYKGSESLVDGVTGQSANKKYWNIALGAADLAGCTISTKGTADDPDNTTDNVDGGTIAAGTVYPYVTWNVTVDSCTQHPLTFGDPNAFVGTDYTTTTGSALTFFNIY